MIQNTFLTFEVTASPREGLLPNQLQPKTRSQASAQNPVPERSATKYSALQHVTKRLKRMDALTFIWSVMSHSLSTLERHGLNGEKASDWLRLCAPKWGRVRF